MKRASKITAIILDIAILCIVLSGVLFGAFWAEKTFSFFDYSAWNALFAGIISVVSLCVLPSWKKEKAPRPIVLLKLAALSSSLIAFVETFSFSYPFYNPNSASWGLFIEGEAIFLGVFLPLLLGVQFALLPKNRKNVWIDGLSGIGLPLLYAVIFSILKAMRAFSGLKLPETTLSYLEPANVPSYVVYLGLFVAVVLSYFIAVLILLPIEKEVEHHPVSEACVEAAASAKKQESSEEEKKEENKKSPQNNNETKVEVTQQEPVKEEKQSPKKPRAQAARKPQDDVDVIQDEAGTEESEMEEERKQIAAAKAGDYGEGPRVYHISRQASTGAWQVKLATGKRAIRVFKTQAAAINFAKGLVRTRGGSIRIHTKKGRLRKE